jgi:hypothetical protein
LLGEPEPIDAGLVGAVELDARTASERADVVEQRRRAEHLGQTRGFEQRGGRLLAVAGRAGVLSGAEDRVGDQIRVARRAADAHRLTPVHRLAGRARRLGHGERAVGAHGRRRRIQRAELRLEQAHALRRRSAASASSRSPSQTSGQR